jgi:hypothetical protein
VPGSVILDTKTKGWIVVKKLIALVLAVAFLAGTIGCSSATTKGDSGKKDESKKDTKP